MDEKTRYLHTREQEFHTTLRVLRAYPHEKGDLRPAQKSKSAQELAWVFAAEESMLPRILKGEGFGPGEQMPATFEEIIARFEHEHKRTSELIKELGDKDLAQTVPFPVAPKQMGEVRKLDLLWMFLLDHVHHRGQFSIYLRMAGAKVPSIYGPTADEPWQ